MGRNVRAINRDPATASFLNSSRVLQRIGHVHATVRSPTVVHDRHHHVRGHTYQPLLILQPAISHRLQAPLVNFDATAKRVNESNTSALIYSAARMLDHSPLYSAGC